MGETIMQEKIEIFLRDSDYPPMIIDMNQNNEITLKLTGPCSQCPSGQQELQEVYQSLLLERFPQLNAVHWRQGVSDGLLKEAFRILRKNL